MIIYTDKFLKDWMAGRQIWFLALVRPKFRGDMSITEHEKEHIRQWYLTTFVFGVLCGFGAYVASVYLGVPWTNLLPLAAVPPSMHGALYTLLRKYRMWAEVQAHKVSLRYRPANLSFYAHALASNYRLKISEGEARQLLTQ